MINTSIIFVHDLIKKKKKGESSLKIYKRYLYLLKLFFSFIINKNLFKNLV